VHAGHRAEAGRPGPGRADHGTRDHDARRRPHQGRVAGRLQPEDVDAGQHRRCVPPGAARVAEHDGLRRAVPVPGMEGRREHVVRAQPGNQGRCLAGVEKPGGDAELVLQVDGGRERLDVPGAGEEEEVAVAVQVDLLPGALAERGEGRQPAGAQLDVERVGELRPDAARRPGRRAAAELAALEEQDVDSCLGEVERRAGTHDATTDDDDVGAGRQPMRTHAAHGACCRRPKGRWLSLPGLARAEAGAFGRVGHRRVAPFPVPSPRLIARCPRDCRRILESSRRRCSLTRQPVVVRDSWRLSGCPPSGGLVVLLTRA
jgi:hypothetical protein